MPEYELPPAAHPMTVKIILGEAHFNYMINRAKTDYRLYAHSGYEPIPEKGDVFGIVAQLVRLARLANSGVIEISVSSHRVVAVCSQAVSLPEREKLLCNAIRAAALGIAC